MIVMEDDDDGDEYESFTVFMRPLKVKEIQVLNRVTYLQDIDANDQQAAMMLVSLAVRTLNVSSDEVPSAAASGLVGKMIEYNFPKIDNGPGKKKSKKGGLIDCLDFLILHNHKYSEIMEYPIPLFNDFINTIAERTGAKKKPMDAREAFGKLGIPVRNRGDKKTP